MSDASAPLLLLLTASDVLGGTERQSINLARAIRTAGWRVQHVFPKTQRVSVLMSWCRSQGIEAETSCALKTPLERHTHRDVLALRRLVQQRNPTVVNLHFGHTNIGLKDVLAVRLAGRYRCVVTVNHPEPWSIVGEHKRRMTGIAGRLADAVVVISHATRDRMLEAGVPARKLHLIHCGMPVPPSHPERAEARQRLGLPADAFIVGCLAQLEPHKGVADLIDAAARLADPDGKLLLVIAGDGPQRAVLQAQAVSQLGARARFLGRLPETGDFYAALDVFTLPSHMEGFGMVYVEAAFHGVPSIGTSVGGIPDAISDGKTGILVPPNSPEAVAAAIQQLRTDIRMRARLGSAAQARARREFTEQSMGESYRTIFNLAATDVRLKTRGVVAGTLAR